MSTIESRLDIQRKEQKEALVKEMLNKGDEYFNLIVERPIANIQRLPEATFVKSFLPYFCGELPITPESNIIAIWVGIAGSITAKVHIVDKDDQILFTVPPMNDTSIFDVNNKKQAQGFKNIVLNYKLYSNQTPMSAQNYLDRTIDGRLDKLRSDSSVFNENELTWRSIFERYSKIPKQKDTNSVRKDTLDDDELIYD